MRKSLWIMLAVIFVAIGAPHAQADTMTNYTISFTGTGILPTSGSFTYDSTTPGFSNFVVVWDGLTFDMTAGANSPGIIGPTPPACLNGDSGAATSFQLLTNCGGPDTAWNSFNGGSETQEMMFITASTSSLCGLAEDCASITGGAVTNSVTPLGATIGTFTVAEVVPTPEPSSLTLMLLAVGFVFVMRRRIAKKLLQTS